MTRLTILYDAACPLCIRCRQWMDEQPAYVELEWLAAGSTEARSRYGAVPWRDRELVVIGDGGEVWAGPAAFVVCLWALREWRPWAFRLASPRLLPLAERFFHALSARRRRLAVWLGLQACEGDRCGASASPYR
jgi:predicted DCC family thiol-disulfide oxidoreductase YuxK